MVGLLFQAITNKQMVSFSYRGLTRYVKPQSIFCTSESTILNGLEYGSPMERKYNIGEMVGLAIVEDPDDPKVGQFTPWVEDIKDELSVEEKLMKSAAH